MKKDNLPSLTSTILVGAYLLEEEDKRSFEDRLQEASGLAEAICVNVVQVLTIPVKNPRPKTYIGSGKVAELAKLVDEFGIELVIFDSSLSPIQQRNLEEEIKAKVIDRVALILEIFGLRALTREGMLQVEHARLAYQKSRLVRSWTHLERQRGGFGFMGGPGETQLEVDRRIIQKRLARIEKDLEKVKRTRSLNRKRRDKVPYPMIVLVGYTNAGKSTLFNALTQANVSAKNALFETLDPTVRRVRLSKGFDVMVTDTVGFVSRLPTLLVAAFQATLEDVIRADVIIHVRDISRHDSDQQRDDVMKILEDIQVPQDKRESVIEVWNKIDLLSEEKRDFSLDQRKRSEEGAPLMISAKTGEGVETLLEATENMLVQGKEIISCRIDAQEGKAIHWLYAHADILAREEFDDGQVRFLARVSPKNKNLLEKKTQIITKEEFFPTRLLQ